MYIRFEVQYFAIYANIRSNRNQLVDIFTSILEHEFVIHMYKFVLISVDQTNTFERWFFISFTFVFY